MADLDEAWEGRSIERQEMLKRGRGGNEGQ